jgi:proteasome lid subunit RPN8/RPN11
VQMLPIENALHSPVRFCMAPAAQLQAFQALEADGLDLLAIFHSHPTGPREPSPTDLAEFAYPGVLSLILFPTDAQAWSARAFHIQGALFSGETPASFTEVPLVFSRNASAATG